ncbi:MAG: DUF3696 domain-containing protein [Candidatus Acidiferrales bacterium]
MIREIHLTNFKCFRSQTIKFGQLTLLTGLNSSGKSTIIQSLLLLRQSYVENMLPDIGLAINGPLAQLGTAKDVLHEEADADQVRLRLVEDAVMDLSLTFSYQENSDVLDLSYIRPVGDVWSMNLFTDNFQYLRAERLGPRTSFGLSDFEVRRHRRIGISGEYATHFLSVYGGEAMEHFGLRHSLALSNALKSQVEAWMAEISPGVRLNVTLYSDIDLITFGVSYMLGGQVASTEYRPTNVGFGITYALPVVVALLSARVGGLVIVENPEAHLHPRGQVKIGELIARAASAGVQVIVETHSEHVLNGIRIAVHSGAVPDPSIISIYYSKWETGGTSPTLTPVTVDNRGRLSDWPEGFFDETERSLDSLLDGN